MLSNQKILNMKYSYFVWPDIGYYYQNIHTLCHYAHDFRLKFLQIQNQISLAKLDAISAIGK